MSFWIDDVPLMLDDFAVCATVAGKEVLAIYEAASDVSTAGTIGMGSSSPVLILATADVPAESYGAAVTVPNIGNFTVIETRHDGTGVTVLVLEKA